MLIVWTVTYRVIGQFCGDGTESGDTKYLGDILVLKRTFCYGNAPEKIHKYDVCSKVESLEVSIERSVSKSYM
jgi:hypothetical protein